jgi:hypothetical protein
MSNVDDRIWLDIALVSSIRTRNDNLFEPFDYCYDSEQWIEHIYTYFYWISIVYDLFDRLVSECRHHNDLFDEYDEQRNVNAMIACQCTITPRDYRRCEQCLMFVLPIAAFSHWIERWRLFILMLNINVLLTSTICPRDKKHNEHFAM